MTQKHPKGLGLLFFTELWERFGFYTQQTILVLYMTHALGFNDKNADFFYGAYSALLYLTPALGGYIADRFLGFQKAIVWGGLLFILGYLLSAFPGEKLFFIGLSILIVANGFFKPNVSSIVGTLYAPGDQRRDAGFTLFYMGINIGALLPTIFIGYVVNHIGWHTGLLFAAVGMIIGQVTFRLGRSRLGGHGGVPEHSPIYQKKISARKFNVLLAIGVVAAIAFFRFCLEFPKSTNTVVVIGAALIFCAVIYFMAREKREQRNKMIASLVLIAISVVFWSIYNQTFSSLMLFADRNMSTHFLGFTINAEFTQFFNPFFIIALSPILSRFWIQLAKKQRNPSTPMKFALGVLFTALGFLLLAVGSRFFAHAGLTSPWWLVTSYLLQTTGELLISPVGLAMITLLAPRKLVGMMMGVWFLAQAASFAIGGGLASLASIPSHLSAVASLPIYTHAFTLFGSISVVFSLISFALVPVLKSLIRDKRVSKETFEPTDLNAEVTGEA